MPADSKREKSDTCGFLNPAGLAGTDDEILAGYRRVRDTKKSRKWE